MKYYLIKFKYTLKNFYSSQFQFKIFLILNINLPSAFYPLSYVIVSVDDRVTSIYCRARSKIMA